MTYNVTIQNGLNPEVDIYYQEDDSLQIYNDSLQLNIGEAGIFTFSVPLIHPYINDIKERETIVTIYRDNDEWWRGEVREINQLFDMSREIICYEDIAWLYDSDIVPQSATRTYTQWFQQAISKYNSDVAILGTQRASRKFDIGYIDNDTGLSRHCDVGYGVSVMDFIRQNINTAYGYLRVRRVKESGVQKRYIDVVRLANYGSVINQSIEFGENMLDYVEEADTSNLITGIHPLGAEIDGEELIPDVAKRVDITSVNSGSDYLVDSVSCQRFGWIMKTVFWDDISNPSTLKRKAQEYLSEHKNPRYTWSLNAVDLSVLDMSIDSISLGSQVQIYAEPFGIDTSVPVTKLDISITDASKNSVELADEVRNTSLSSQISATNAAMERMPEESELLHSAKLNALNMLNGAIGGHVIFKFDATNRYVEELIICNASTEVASTRKWVYNLNGWGYMKRDTVTDEWEDLGVAATMDGEIIADFITAGTLRAIDIEGVSITGGTITGGTITGGTITGGTITGSVINSPSPTGQTGSVRISGGTLEVKDGTSGFMQLKKAGNESTYTALGGGNWACGRSGYYRELDARYIFDAGYAFQQANSPLTQTIDAYVWGPQGAQRADLIFRNGLLIGVNYK